jgi:hypothetical protein
MKRLQRRYFAALPLLQEPHTPHSISSVVQIEAELVLIKRNLAERTREGRQATAKTMMAG